MIGKSKITGLAFALWLCLPWSIVCSQELEQPAPVSAQAPEPELQFDIWEYRVLGNSTLSIQDIEKTLYPLVGPGKRMTDVESARQALEKTYHDAGYGTVFVDIPEQSAEEGIIRLKVTEGRLDRVRITGARYFSNGQIRTALPALTAGGVPHLPQVQKELTALNQITADRTVVPVLKSGRMQGTVDVELKVSDELPLHGSLEVNDRYSADTSRWRVSGALSYNNLFQRQQGVSLQYQTAPQERDDVEAFVASYTYRKPEWGTTFVLYGVDSDTDVAALGTLSVLGKGKVLGTRMIRSLPSSENYYHGVQFGLDYKDFNENIVLADDVTLETPIHYLNWSVAYDSTLRSKAGTTGFNLSANLGTRAIVNDGQEFGDKRSRAAPNYFYLRGGVQHTVDLPWTLQTFGKLTAQFTPDPLVSNEQLSIGGADTVRGYLESSQLGDYGAVGTMEIRSVAPATWLKRPPNSVYVFAFYDAGIVSVLHPLPSQTARFDLSSVGFGVRAIDLYRFDVAVDWAHVFDDSGKTEAGDERFHFSLRYSF